MSTNQEGNAEVTAEANYVERKDVPLRKGLNYLNIGNLIAYTANVVLTYGFGSGGWGGTQSIEEISDKHQTIITPIGWAFSIWSVIYIAQATFTVAQLLPRFRSSPMVQDGVKYWYILACFFQVSWTFVWGNEIIWLSVMVILLVTLCLTILLISQYFIPTSDTSCILEYCLLQFPFQIHCGWLIGASLVNVNVSVVSEGNTLSMQLTAAIISLGVILSVATFVLFVPVRPNYVIALVLSWASGGIAQELRNPSSAITNFFNDDIITAMKNAAASFSVIILIMVGVRLILLILSNFFNMFSMFSSRAVAYQREITVNSMKGSQDIIVGDDML